MRANIRRRVKFAHLVIKEFPTFITNFREAKALQALKVYSSLIYDQGLTNCSKKKKKKTRKSSSSSNEIVKASDGRTCGRVGESREFGVS
jgi:hypothetical protein